MTEVLVPQEEREQSLPALFGDDRNQALAQMESFVKVIASRCQGAQFVVNIDGRKYAKVEWWTAVGNSLGILPRTDSMEVIDSDSAMKRRAWVSLWRDGQPMGPRASGVCSSNEITKKRDGTIRHRWLDSEGQPIEYAIESMAMTRATGKAFRQSLSILPVLAGLQPTPAEEMDSGQFSNKSTGGTPAEFNRAASLGFGKHKDVAWKDVESGYLEWLIDNGSGDRAKFAQMELDARKNESDLAGHSKAAPRDTIESLIAKVHKGLDSISGAAASGLLDDWLGKTGHKAVEDGTEDELRVLLGNLRAEYKAEQALDGDPS